jgi:hypothetical protein
MWHTCTQVNKHVFTEHNTKCVMTLLGNQWVINPYWVSRPSRWSSSVWAAPNGSCCKLDQKNTYYQVINFSTFQQSSSETLYHQCSAFCSSWDLTDICKMHNIGHVQLQQSITSNYLYIPNVRTQPLAMQHHINKAHMLKTKPRIAILFFPQHKPQAEMFRFYIGWNYNLGSCTSSI